MRNGRWILLSLLLIGIVSVSMVPAGAGFGQEEKTAESPAAAVRNGRSLQVGEWLVLGPLDTPLPAFHETEKQDDDALFLLSYGTMDVSRFVPSEGGRVDVLGGDMVWFRAAADTAGALIEHSDKHPSTAYLAAWMELPRWMKVEFEASSTDPFELFVDGKSVLKCTSATGTGGLGEIKEGSAELKQGKHLIVAKTVRVPADTASDWRLNAYVEPGEGFDAAPSLTLDPSVRLDIHRVLDPPNVAGIRVSPDGDLAMINYWQFIPPEGGRDSWTEIRRLPNGELVNTLRDTDMSSLQWAPEGKRISYVTRDGDKGAIRILDTKTGEVETVIEGVEHLGHYIWSPDGSYIVYYTSQDYKPDGTGIKRLLGIEDRQSYARNRTSVFLTSVPGGMTRKLATGKYDAFVGDIDPTGRKLILRKDYEDLSDRPFGKTELVLLHLGDMTTESLFTGLWVGSAEWSPDGSRILISGGPSTFGEIGKDVAEDVIPNDYDGQLYIFDPETKEAEAITKDFDPAVGGAIWSRKDGRIYFSAERGEFEKLFSYDPGRKKIREIPTRGDVVVDWDVAVDEATAVYAAMGAVSPVSIWSLDLHKGKSREIVQPGAGMLQHLKLGKLEVFDFVTESGRTITGRVHYPPDFDPSRLYPCIVYYYGGTSPVTRRFGGRYPLNLWAGKDYIVYCLQPSGATGFGQEFSTTHVNDWGKTTVDEIIDGVKKFLDAHPFVNPYRVGCEGASFGGFMTQLIITRTDLFAAAVSHAGISMIGSYWGEGYWGYAYNAVAAAESYPWNRPDIYVDQSPLFAADRIVTPLLLTHGAVDINVPPGESEQMYTALKILGKEVEYLKYDGQSHFILDYRKRMAWSDAQVAWFDKWLKDEPEWWDSMYPPVKTAVKRMPEYMGKFVFDLDEESRAVLGEVTREDIVGAIDGWDSETFSYTPDEAVVKELEEYIYGVDITCVLGTWCSDSRREVPRLWKILEQLEYPLSEITMYAVGSSRFGPELQVPARALHWSDLLKDYYGVERVATIIVKRNGVEIGRIVETPKESLEKDLLEIVKSGD